MNGASHWYLSSVLSGEPTANEATRTKLLERQKEYKLAALRAKKQGDMEQAKLYFKTSKVNQRATVISCFFKKKSLFSVSRFIS